MPRIGAKTSLNKNVTLKYKNVLFTVFKHIIKTGAKTDIKHAVWQRN